MKAPISGGSVSLSGLTEGTAFSGTVATCTDPGLAATAGEYSATIDWGDGSAQDMGHSLEPVPRTTIGTSVLFWGSKWAKNNPLIGKPPASFKGFEDQPALPRAGRAGRPAPATPAWSRQRRCEATSR